MKRAAGTTPAIAALGFGLLLAIAVAEILLRWTGHGPWKEMDLDSGLRIPPMHEPDEELGWRNKEGKYVFGTTAPTRMTFWPDHTRATAPEPVRSAASVVVLGCSFVQGWGLSDEDTFAWKLQQGFPGLRMSNLGTAGYGTVQSLLALQRFLREDGYDAGHAGGRPPLVVVYGFSDFHAARNVAPAPWLKTLAQLASRAHVATPYATYDSAGNLGIHAPVSYPAWPLHRELALVALLEDRWAMFDARERSAQATAVTRDLLFELNYVVQQAGGKLVVALLSQFERDGLAPYREVLEHGAFLTADCVHPGVWKPAGQVPYTGHPNADVNGYWADCIASDLRLLAPAPAGMAEAAHP